MQAGVAQAFTPDHPNVHLNHLRSQEPHPSDEVVQIPQLADATTFSDSQPINDSSGSREARTRSFADRLQHHSLQSVKEVSHDPA
jgi:hypothetical protein